MMCCLANQWSDGLLEFIETFWHQNSTFNKVSPRDERLKNILEYIPEEIAFASSWFADQLEGWKKSVREEIIDEMRGIIMLVSSLSMICLQYIRVCSEVAKMDRNKPSGSSTQGSSNFAPGNSGEPINDLPRENTNTKKLKWKKYRCLPDGETINSQLLMYHTVRNILRNVKSCCREQENLIMKNLFGEKENKSLGPTKIPLSFGLEASCERDTSQESDQGPQTFLKLIETLLEIFSCSEPSPRCDSSRKKARLKRLAYGESTPQKLSYNKKFTTVVFKPKSAVLDSKIVAEKYPGVSVFGVLEGIDIDHVILYVPVDHPLEWGDENKAPPVLLLLIRIQNCAIETWEMIAETELSSSSFASYSNKVCIKGVFNTLYKCLKVLKRCTSLSKEVFGIKGTLWLRAMTILTREETTVPPKKPSSDSELGNRLSATMLSLPKTRSHFYHKQRIKRKNYSVLRPCLMRVKMQGEFTVVQMKAPVSSEASTRASEGPSSHSSD